MIEEDEAEEEDTLSITGVESTGIGTGKVDTWCKDGDDDKEDADAGAGAVEAVGS